MEIILNPVGGLANRMRAIASGISLSLDCGIPIGHIAWTVDSELYCPFENLFEPLPIDAKVIDISGVKKTFMYDGPRKKNFYISNLLQKNRYCGKIIGSHNDILNYVQTLANRAKPLLIQSGTIFYDFTSELYKRMLIPRRDLVEQAKKRITGKSASRLIGVHIRRTDNSISIAQSPTTLFIDKIRQELDSDSDVSFYLATDDESVKAELSNIFGDSITCSPEKASRNTVAGIREGLVEMLCLSLCDKIYGSYWSSFSEAAAIMGGIELIQLCKDSRQTPDKIHTGL